MRCLWLAAGLMAAAGSAPASVGQDIDSPVVVVLPTMPLVIHAGRHAWRFRVEVARTAQQQQRGLMFRKSVAPMGGMLFPFDPPHPASFWMRNTMVPLDMVFIRADGSIARIAARTTPLTLDPVEVGEPVAAVLELAGGRAAALGITEGARVTWRGGPA